MTIDASTVLATLSPEAQEALRTHFTSQIVDRVSKAFDDWPAPRQAIAPQVTCAATPEKSESARRPAFRPMSHVTDKPPSELKPPSARRGFRSARIPNILDNGALSASHNAREYFRKFPQGTIRGCVGYCVDKGFAKMNENIAYNARTDVRRERGEI